MCNLKLFICIVCLTGISCFQANGADMKKIVNSHGKEYIKLRNAVLSNKQTSLVEKNDDIRLLLLASMLEARKKHPELFQKLAGIVKKCTVPRQPRRARLDSPLPYIFLTGKIRKFMQQGIEKKEYITTEITKKSAPYMVDVKHYQTDKQVADAKVMNEVARLAIIEYLWKLTDDWRVEYELLDVFYWISGIKKLDKKLLPVFEDVFKRSNHFMVLKMCLNIFSNEKYKKALPLMRKKLNQCFEIKNYKSCNVIIVFLEKEGDKNDMEIIENLKPKLAKLKSVADAKIAKQKKAAAKEKEKKELDDLHLIID